MLGLLITLFAGLFFLVGVFLAIKSKNSKNLINFSIGMAFSVLIFLLCFDIFPETYSLFYQNVWLSIIGGILIGYGILLLFEKLIPHHDHFEEIKHHNNHLNHIGIMTSIALIIHNIVEGMSIFGVSESSIKSSIIYTIGVGLHNIPFGIEITAMLNQKNKKNLWIYVSLLTFSTFFGGLILFFFNGFINDFVLGILLSMTMGMILYLLFNELFVELKENFNKYSFYGIILGIFLVLLGSIL